MSLLGSWTIELWDCEGGIESFGLVPASELFQDVAALVYVFDLTSESLGTRDVSDFEAVIRTMREEGSAGACETPVFVMLHKTDRSVSSTGSPSAAVREREAEIRRRALPTLAHCYATSIWDESLYRAWAAVLAALLPIGGHLQAELSRLAERLRAEEIVLYERSTLLAIGHVARRHHGDSHRYEKISNMMKRLWACTKKLNATPQRIKLRLVEGRRILVEQLDERVLLLAVTHATEEAGGSAEGDLQAGLVAFQSVLSAVMEGRPEVDPHML